MPGQVVLVLLLTFGAATTAPLTDREKQNRIVAVSQADASLLSAAVSKASPDLLRVALTAADPDLLETALTASDPDLLIAALNNVDPDLLAVALTKSKKDLLTTALTEAKAELLRTALNAPTNSAILEVALTHSTPELLKIALQDATVDNLIVALTAADGSAGTASGQSASAKLRIKDQADSVPVVEDTSNRESDKVDLSEKSGESKVYNVEIEENSASIVKEIEESPNTKLASDTESPTVAPSSGFDSYPAVPDQEHQVPSLKIEGMKKPAARVRDGALPISVVTTLENVENKAVEEFVVPPDTTYQLETGRPYGALSNSVQTTIGNLEKSTREEYAKPINPYQQEAGRANLALFLSNSVQSRQGNTMFYQDLPVTVSGGYSYNSGWLHQDTVVRPGQTFPIYVPGHHQLPVYLV